LNGLLRGREDREKGRTGAKGSEVSGGGDGLAFREKNEKVSAYEVACR